MTRSKDNPHDPSRRKSDAASNNCPKKILSVDETVFHFDSNADDSSYQPHILIAKRKSMNWTPTFADVNSARGRVCIVIEPTREKESFFYEE